MAGPRRQTYVHKFKKRFEEINVFGVKIRVLDRYRIAVTPEQQVAEFCHECGRELPGKGADHYCSGSPIPKRSTAQREYLKQVECEENDDACSRTTCSESASRDSSLP